MQSLDTAAGLLADQPTIDAVNAVKQGIVNGHRLRDRDALDRLYADDFTASTPNGRVRTKTDLLDGLPNESEMIEGHYELGVVRRWGPLVVAAGHGRMIYGQPDGGQRVSEYDSVNVFEERAGRWFYVAAYLP